MNEILEQLFTKEQLKDVSEPTVNFVPKNNGTLDVEIKKKDGTIITPFSIQYKKDIDAEALDYANFHLSVMAYYLPIISYMLDYHEYKLESGFVNIKPEDMLVISITQFIDTHRDKLQERLSDLFDVNKWDVNKDVEAGS